MHMMDEMTWVEKGDASGGTVGGIRKPTCKGKRLMLVVVAWVGWVGLNWYFRVRRTQETITMK